MKFEGRDRQDTSRYLSSTIYTKLDELTLITHPTAIATNNLDPAIILLTCEFLDLAEHVRGIKTDILRFL